jgi:phage terminase large subunit
VSENENIIPVEASDEPIDNVYKDVAAPEKEDTELLTAEDIKIFLANESVIAAQSCSQKMIE